MTDAPPPTLILGSTSRYRRQLLERLGIPFVVQAPSCDEEALKDLLLKPQALAERLAEAKAQSIASQQPDAVVIGGDQVAAFTDADGWHVLDKPGTPERALAQLRCLAAREHQLYTAMVVCHGSRVMRHTDITNLTMRDLDDAALERYVAIDQPLDCAGSYKLEALGISLFTRIQTEDSSAITGLPLIALTSMLRRLGYNVP